MRDVILSLDLLGQQSRLSHDAGYDPDAGRLYIMGPWLS